VNDEETESFLILKGQVEYLAKAVGDLKAQTLAARMTAKGRAERENESKVIQEVKGPTKPPVSLVDLEVAQAKSDARLAGQSFTNKWTVRVVGVSACGLVILEPISMLVSNYVASVTIGILSLFFLAFGWTIRLTIPERREALQQKAEADIRYTHGVMEWERYHEEVAKQSANLDSRKQLPWVNPGSGE
jgi:VIT1/CCC1 family predicted Fe2+/Mn2+ transporter